ncbi:MAG: ATP-binding protein [Oscillospiraceae bacterium]
MSENILSSYAARLEALSVFRGVLENDIVRRLKLLLEAPAPDTYGGFAGALYTKGDDLSEVLLEIVIEDENPFMLRLAAYEEVPPCVEKAAKAELASLQEISRLTSDAVKSAIGENADYIPAEWRTSDIDFVKAYTERMSELSTKGFGIFAKYHTFTLRDGKLVPVKNPDPQRLFQLSGYELERGRVINNTMALLSDKPAANVLLYGDAGTGKSSTVKAIANEYKDMGLRLIELNKAQLAELPDVIEKIAGNPLKFIIFVDDVSFSSDDDNFSSLKAALEGSVSAKTSNIAIYATSNRRHLVKERFSDRDGDDIHAGDTREELISLSERFGLKVAFLKPNKETYLSIVAALAKAHGIEVNDDLFMRAEAYALRRNGRSGRAARHFIDSVCSEM